MSRLTADVSEVGRDDLGFGPRLRRARLDAQLTFLELAGAVGVDIGTVRGWESRGRVPRDAHVFQLADALGVSARWLRDGDGPIARERPPQVSRDEGGIEETA